MRIPHKALRFTQLRLAMGAQKLAGVVVLLFASQFKQDADELVTDSDHRLFLLQRIIPARCEVEVQRGTLDSWRPWSMPPMAMKQIDSG